jgi:hypothetical protein
MLQIEAVTGSNNAAYTPQIAPQPLPRSNAAFQKAMIAPRSTRQIGRITKTRRKDDQTGTIVAAIHSKNLKNTK